VGRLSNNINQWCAGIDAGFTRTGLALFSPLFALIAWSTFEMPATTHDSVRASNLAHTITIQIADWVDKYKIDSIRVGLETPIYNYNPKTHAKQWRLVQQIEHNLRGLAPIVELVEVSPTTSKRILTGNGGATKADMIFFSPFKDVNMNSECKEALADSTGHAKAALELPTTVDYRTEKWQILNPVTIGEAKYD